MTYKLLLSLLVLISSLHANEEKGEGTRLIHFDVLRGDIKKTSPESPLIEGKAIARGVEIDFGSEKFELDKGSNPVEVEVSWNEESSRLAIKKDGLRFSTPLAEGLGIRGLDRVTLHDASVTLDKKGVTMKGKSLSFAHELFSGNFSNANIFCPTYGNISTEIDVVCLRESRSEVGVIEVRQRGLDADFINAISDITPESFSLEALTARFNDDVDSTEVRSFSMSCKNLVEAMQVDHYRILQGCLDDGKMNISSMDVSQAFVEAFEEVWPKAVAQGHVTENQKALIDLDNIKDVSLTLSNGDLNFMAKIKAVFRVKIKVKGKLSIDVKAGELLFKIERATIWGIPTGKLAYRIIEKFARKDFLEIRGDIIALKI